MLRYMFREAGVRDIPRILELEQVLFENSMTEAVLERELEVGKGYVWVDNLHAKVLGYALVREEEGLLDLTRLGVDPEAQGTGVGRKLLRRVLALRQDTILTVLKTNHRALRLYLRHGFEVVGHVTSADAWVLRRQP